MSTADQFKRQFKRLARSLGIVAIFTTVGPIVAAAVFCAFVLVVGVSVLDLMLEFVDLQALRPWLSIAIYLLAFFCVVAAIPASIVAGAAFAVSSVYWGMNSLLTALVIAGCMVIGVVMLGFVVSPSESSPLLLPSVAGLRQAGFLALFLTIPAEIAASLCWLCSRPLHRPV
jgi:hypothetical protein